MVNWTFPNGVCQNSIFLQNLVSPHIFQPQLGNSEAENTDRRQRWQGNLHRSKQIEKMEKKGNKPKITETKQTIADKTLVRNLKFKPKKKYQIRKWNNNF